jgi:hypothetical protein
MSVGETIVDTYRYELTSRLCFSSVRSKRFITAHFWSLAFCAAIRFLILRLSRFSASDMWLRFSRFRFGAEPPLSGELFLESFAALEEPDVDGNEAREDILVEVLGPIDSIKVNSDGTITTGVLDECRTARLIPRPFLSAFSVIINENQSTSPHLNVNRKRH